MKIQTIFGELTVTQGLKSITLTQHNVEIVVSDYNKWMWLSWLRLFGVNSVEEFESFMNPQYAIYGNKRVEFLSKKDPNDPNVEHNIMCDAGEEKITFVTPIIRSQKDSKGNNMQYEEYQEHGENFIRVNKTKARQKFNEGKTVYLIQDMMRLPNAWEMPCPIDNTRDSAIGRDFDSHVRDFQYYNCDNERGRGVKYFINSKDL